MLQVPYVTGMMRASLMKRLMHDVQGMRYNKRLESKV